MNKTLTYFNLYQILRKLGLSSYLVQGGSKIVAASISDDEIVFTATMRGE